MTQREIIEASAGDRIELIADSHFRLNGQALVENGPDRAKAMWHAPAVILAHAGGSDPVFFYGNSAALGLFEVSAAQLLSMPSRLSAEPDGRAERQRLLEIVSRDGMISDYAGIRVSRTGRRFRIKRATVWNLVDGDGVVHGQAACFADWHEL